MITLLIVGFFPQAAFVGRPGPLYMKETFSLFSSKTVVTLVGLWWVPPLTRSQWKPPSWLQGSGPRTEERPPMLCGQVSTPREGILPLPSQWDTCCGKWGSASLDVV